MWMRDNFQKVSGAQAAMMFFCFFEGEPLVEVDRMRDGPVQQCQGMVIKPLGAPRSSLQELLGFDLMENSYDLLLSAPQRERLLRANSVVMVGGQVEDPPGLQLLWNSMGVVRAAAFGGAFLCLDLMARRWWTDSQLKSLDPQRQFAIEEHIVVNTIADESPAFARTAGMEKFARPDLVIPNLRAEAGVMSAATALLNEIAHRMAEGKSYGETSLLRLHYPDSLIETEFVPASPAENDFYGTSKALVVVDPNRDASPMERKRQGCPRAVALVQMARQPNAPQNQEVGDQPTAPFSSLLPGSLKLIGHLAGEHPNIFVAITGRPWDSATPESHRVARERLQRLVGQPRAEGRSDRELLFAVAAARVAEEKLDHSFVLDGCSEAVRLLYESHLEFVRKTEFGPLFGVEKLEEELPAEVTIGLWLCYGYRGSLPTALEVEDCASLGVLFGLKVGDLELTLQGRATSLDQLARVAEPFWNPIYEKLGRELSKFIPIARLSMVDQLAGRTVSEPSAETSQQAYVSICTLLEQQTGRVTEAPPISAAVRVKFAGRETELTLFRSLFCALLAHLVCDEHDLNFPTEECDPRMVIAYAGVVALSASTPVGPGAPYIARADRAARTFFRLFGAQVSPQALPVVEQLSAMLAQAAARVARMTGVSSH